MVSLANVGFAWHACELPFCAAGALCSGQAFLGLWPSGGTCALLWAWAHLVLWALHGTPVNCLSPCAAGAVQWSRAWFAAGGSVAGQTQRSTAWQTHTRMGGGRRITQPEGLHTSGALVLASQAGGKGAVPSACRRLHGPHAYKQHAWVACVTTASTRLAAAPSSQDRQRDRLSSSPMVCMV